MAKMYNVREMADAFNSKNYEAQVDFGSRYPLVAIKMAALFAKAPDEAYEFLMALPEYLTGQKLNTSFKNEYLGDSEESEDTEEVEIKDEPKKTEKPVKKAKAEKTENEGSEYASMSCRELLDLITKNKLRKHYLEKTNGDTKYAKATMVEYFEKYGLSGASKKVEDKPAPTKAKAKKVEKDEDNWDDEEEETKEDLSSKTPLQLYDICQKRGIKAKTRQPKEYYLNLIKEAEVVSGGPEDWDDEGEEEALEAAKKPAKKADKKPVKKVEKKEEPVEDDDDDSWDI